MFVTTDRLRELVNAAAASLSENLRDDDTHSEIIMHQQTLLWSEDWFNGLLARWRESAGADAPSDSNARALVIALERFGVTAQMDTEGALITLECVQEMEQAGWQFIPPPDPQ